MALMQILAGTSILIGNQTITWENAAVGVYAVDLESGRVLCSVNETTSLHPASAIKIAGTIAALELLGPDYHFQTQLEYDGTLDAQGILHGNLYIRGGGDPCLGSGRAKGSLHWKEQLNVWVAAVKQAGIKEITGSVIGDATRWESALAAPSWGFDDIGNYYGVGASALSFHENMYHLSFEPGSHVGDAAKIIRTDPPIPMLSLENEVTTGPEGSGDRACIFGIELVPFQRVRGTIPAGVETFTIKGAIPDPAAFCASSLTDALTRHGIRVAQKDPASTDSRICIHTTDSPPLSEIVYWTNWNSVNLYSEHLLKAVGETVFHEGSTLAGTRALTQFFEKRGLDTRGWKLSDGSGLSPRDFVTAKQLVQLLQIASNSPTFPVFKASLPSEMPGVIGKTGSCSHTRAFAGYAGSIAFAVVVNHMTDLGDADKLWQVVSEIGKLQHALPISMDMPTKLYKILSISDWQASQTKDVLQLPAEDKAFVHFSMEDQLDRILSKYWNDREGVVLTIDPSKLTGTLVLEANHGGVTQYYHLYNGSIPRAAVMEVRAHTTENAASISK